MSLQDATIKFKRFSLSLALLPPDHSPLLTDKYPLISLSCLGQDVF